MSAGGSGGFGANTGVAQTAGQNGGASTFGRDCMRMAMVNKSLDLLQCRSAALKSYAALALALISLSWEDVTAGAVEAEPPPPACESLQWVTVQMPDKPTKTRNH